MTADAVGCNLLCAYYCNYSRNLYPAKVGAFYSLIEVADKLEAISEKDKCYKFRVSGAESWLRINRLAESRNIFDWTPKIEARKDL
jgi:uncharacterized Fe-S cluster-containing radical SAM superfamily protein